MWRSSTSLQPSHFEEHSHTKKHTRAMADPLIASLLTAPPVDDFKDALIKVRSGKANGDDGTGTFKRKKLRKVKFCLAEAVRIATRLRLKEAKAITIHSDGSKGRLLVRGQMCGASLQPHHALLGFGSLEDFSAAGIAATLIGLIKAFATHLHGIDKLLDNDQDGPNIGPILDEDLLRHILACIEVFNADAAADEQLAGTLLTDESVQPNEIVHENVMDEVAAPDSPWRGVLPNVKIVNKDKPHAARRVTSRTWKADPFLNQIATEVVMGKTSIVQLIQWSDVMRTKYGRAVRALQLNPMWRHRSDKFYAAKHRFDSWAAPFARLCLTFDAVVSTAQVTHEERRSEAVGRHAKHFLSLVTEELMLCLGMMADAGEENLRFVRFLDTEHVDTTELATELQHFTNRIVVLFEQGGCLKTGFTAWMIELLSQERVLYIDHNPKRVGGLPPLEMSVVVFRCLQRFRAWCTLAKSVLAAEFPAFEAMQTFSVLSLRSDDHRCDVDHERLCSSAKLEKLAQLLELNKEDLVSQYFDYLPLAQHHFNQQGVTSLEAWRAALHRVGDARCARTVRPSALLGRREARVGQVKVERRQIDDG